MALILITLELANSGDVKVSSMILEFNSAILLINEPRLQGAIKAGQSVLSIMALNTSNPDQFPKLRIDGGLMNVTSLIGNKVKLNNGTVVLDIQKTSTSSKPEEARVVLFSVQYESGLTITAEVRYSPKMGRHYLNVMFIPSARFKSQTEGLCGVMDDDPSND